MLVLTRKLGEKIMIGDNVEVSVLGIRNDRIKLGIVAPADVPVNRQEIQMRIDRDVTRSLIDQSNCLADCA